MKSVMDLKKNGFSFLPGMPDERSESGLSKREYQAVYRCEQYALMHRKVWEEMHVDYYVNWQVINPDYHRERYDRIKKTDPGFARKQSNKFRKKHPDYYEKYWEVNKEKLREYYRKYRRRMRRIKRKEIANRLSQ